MEPVLDNNEESFFSEQLGSTLGGLKVIQSMPSLSRMIWWVGDNVGNVGNSVGNVIMIKFHEQCQELAPLWFSWLRRAWLSYRERCLGSNDINLGHNNITNGKIRLFFTSAPGRTHRLIQIKSLRGIKYTCSDVHKDKVPERPLRWLEGTSLSDVESKYQNLRYECVLRFFICFGK